MDSSRAGRFRLTTAMQLTIALMLTIGWLAWTTGPAHAASTTSQVAVR